MKKKIVSLMLIISSVLFTACGNKETAVSDDSSTGNDSSTTTQFEEVDMGENNHENSVKMADMIASANEGTNIMFSPTSLNFALGMLTEGATGQSLTQLETYLGSDYSTHAKSLLSTISYYNSDDEEYMGYTSKLNISDALWVDKSMSLLDTFSSSVSDNYDATAQEVDFSSPTEAAKTINDWCNDKTEGLIPSLVTDAALNGTSLCITNTVYFEDPWSEPWNVSQKEEDFTNSEGQTESICYMDTEAGCYYENDYATAFSCSYVNGIKFIGILPKSEGDFTLESLDLPGLLESKDTSADEVYAKMPRLNFETSVELTDMLQALGLNGIFENGSELTGITGDELVVDSVIQKTKLELDENGTKAAAATAMTMCTTAAPIEDPVIKEVYLTRPFAFMIYDETSDEILFMGKVNTSEQ